MATILLKSDFVLAQLFGLADDLKATILTSLAAMMSRTREDLDANLAEAFKCIKAMRAKLDSVRDATTQTPSFFAKMKGGFQEFDHRKISNTIDHIDAGISNVTEMLIGTIESSTREGADDVERAVCFLGLAVNAGIEFVSGKALLLPPNYWAQVYNDAMVQLRGEEL